jgi:hypothetical protein
MQKRIKPFIISPYRFWAIGGSEGTNKLTSIIIAVGSFLILVATFIIVRLN